jgi:hypothetical protein
MTTLSIRAIGQRMFEDKTFASTKGGRIFCRTLAHGAFHLGAGSNSNSFTA